VDLKRNIPKLN